MFREEYKKQINRIRAEEGLINGVVLIAEGSPKTGEKSLRTQGQERRRIRRGIVAAAVCLCLSLAMPVLAASSDTFYQLLYTVSPSAAQFFMPVKKSDESNGIKMEVLSAYVHENKAEIYITMEDLTGDRIDGTTDLYDSYSINRPFDSIAHCEFAGYDDDTKTAAFLIIIEEWGGGNISGDKITFSVREFLSGKQKFEDIAVPAELSEIKERVNTQRVSLIGAGGYFKEYLDFFGDEGAEALIQGVPAKEFPVQGIGLTGMGYIDGKLHIQTELKDRGNNDNHGYFYFKDKEGKQIQSIYNFYFMTEDEKGERIDYCEEVFDISKEELQKYELYGNFVTSNTKTEGNWEVTFPLEKIK